MHDTVPPRIRLAYWQDQFTIISSRARHLPGTEHPIWQLLLYCRGSHATAFVQEPRLPTCWQPTPGARISAVLRIGNERHSYRLHVLSIAPI